MKKMKLQTLFQKKFVTFVKIVSTGPTEPSYEKTKFLLKNPHVSVVRGF